MDATASAFGSVTSTIRTLLVDDEPLALRSLESVIETDPAVRVVGTAASGVRALECIEQLRPDLVFLDVQMPGLGGIEVARRIARRAPPLIVFVTAFDQHAIEAFSLHALDYVLKPFSDERLLASIERAKKALRDRNLERLGDRLLRMVESLSGARPPRPGRILIHDGDRVRVVMTDEVDWLQGARNYVELHTARESILHRQTMSAMEATLDAASFVRIHRSTIVNIDRVVAVEGDGASGKVAVLRNGTRLKVSRAHVERLLAALGRGAGSWGDDAPR